MVLTVGLERRPRRRRRRSWRSSFIMALRLAVCLSVDHREHVCVVAPIEACFPKTVGRSRPMSLSARTDLGTSPFTCLVAPATLSPRSRGGEKIVKAAAAAVITVGL